MEVNQKSRQANYELLRIVAMLMIITLHYLDKGKVLGLLTEKLNTTRYLAWILKSFCIVSMNVYVLISGYFGVKQHFNIRKLFVLWRQVFFYSIVIAAICYATGFILLKELNFYTISAYIVPITTEQYWYVTAYFILFLFMPFLNAGIKQLSKKQFQQMLVVTLVLFSVSKTILPLELPIDKGGYDALSFFVLYLIGGYIKLYGISLLQKKSASLMLYLASTIGVFVLTLLIQAIYLETGKLGKIIYYSFDYNHILVMTGSIGLFLLFGHIEVKDNSLSKFICTVSSATFGVYLIHEHPAIRYIWPSWFQTGEFANSPIFLVHCFFTVIVIFTVCTILELARQKLFNLFVKKEMKK